MRSDRSLWSLTKASGLPAARFVADADGRLDLSAFGQRQPAECALRGQSVLISSDRQLPAVQALLALDGVARRLVLCPPDLRAEHLAAVLAEAEVDAVVTDGTGPAADGCAVLPIPTTPATGRDIATEWLLFTSGTTGRPKLVVHSLASLSGPLADGPAAPDLVWATYYDVRRYGGLQILLRALLGGSSLVLSQAGEAVGDFLRRAGAAGVTHLLGTPSHWRRALMSGAAGCISPRYARLSGEVADQAILDALAAAYPGAGIVHAFASTEAGVGFEVTDGLAGFPARFVGATDMKAEVRVVDGSLRLRSARIASRILGGRGAVADKDGFVDTGDIVVRQGERYLFAGRREGVINVGGQKVYPEEVEAVIAQCPAVQAVRVYPRPSPITGAIPAAELVLRPDGPPFDAVRDEVLRLCREALPPYKVPASVRQVDSIALAPSGKVARSIKSDNVARSIKSGNVACA